MTQVVPEQNASCDGPSAKPPGASVEDVLGRAGGVADLIELAAVRGEERAHGAVRRDARIAGVLVDVARPEDAAGAASTAGAATACRPALPAVPPSSAPAATVVPLAPPRPPAPAGPAPPRPPVLVEPPAPPTRSRPPRRRCPSRRPRLRCRPIPSCPRCPSCRPCPSCCSSGARSCPSSSGSRSAGVIVNVFPDAQYEYVTSPPSSEIVTTLPEVV